MEPTSTSPPQQEATKSIRITPELHARLQRLSAGLHNASMNDTIAWLLSPGMVRLNTTPEQRARWKAAAEANGQDVGNFAIARIEAALALGADPGILRRVHDMVYSLTRAHGVLPQHAPGADRQVISARPEHTRS